jgi:hypothetical protein
LRAKVAIADLNKAKADAVAAEISGAGGVTIGVCDVETVIDAMAVGRSALKLSLHGSPVGQTFFKAL